MKSIFSFIVSLFLTISAIAQTPPVPVPPTKVLQPDGTIQLVPVPPAFVYTPYYIDPAIRYQVFLQSRWAQKRWNGGVSNGQYVYSGEDITAEVLAMPITPPPLVLPVNGTQRQVYKWSIYRSTDVVVQYDHTRLELVPIDGANGNGFGIDLNTMDASKTKYTVLAPGLILLHGEALKAPELRTPPQKPQYYQWNFDGLLWQAGYRRIGTLKFRAKQDDFHLPKWGEQRAFIRALSSTVVNGTTYTTQVDGSPVVGTNVLSELRSEGEDIMFGADPKFKVAHYLSAPTTKFNVGDTIPVKIMVKPETKPQMLFSVATSFIWDNTVLELVSMDKTGAPPSMSNGFPHVDPVAINEVALPKDGNAMHNWLNKLGDRAYFDKETTIVTLNFKVLAPFSTTKIDIVKKNDPRLAGIWVSDESQPLGSSRPGWMVLGAQNGTIIYGVLP